MYQLQPRLARQISFAKRSVSGWVTLLHITEQVILPGSW